jgi:tRNA(Ile)-lysidine synthase
MGSLLVKFKQHIKTEFPFLQTGNSSLLLAISGGVDSVVLMHLCIQSGYQVVLAHCNFKLRGQESERDEDFVRTLAQKHNLPVLVNRFDTDSYAQQHRLSVQEAARKLRYDWFKQVIEQEDNAATNSRFIVTAHHANDTIETLLINLFRGTGISGLHGIPAKQGNVLRPLLFAKREEIEAYARENGLDWVEDSTNAQDKYTRNYIRHQLLPAAKEIFSNVEDNLLQNIERFKEVELLYNQAVALHKAKLLEKKGNEWHVPVLKLQKAVPLHSIVWEIIKDFGFTTGQVQEVVKLLEAGNGSYVASASSRIIKNRQWLIIAPQQGEEAQNILVEQSDKQVVFEGGMLEIETTDAPLATGIAGLPVDAFTVYTDASVVQFPLLLRRWKQGDYFYPLGMQKKKKLGKFFIDQKLSKTAKENVWVLESNKKIVWVVGLRIDDRFKITASTQKTTRFGFRVNENTI